jgi:hypothetical protein
MGYSRNYSHLFLLEDVGGGEVLRKLSIFQTNCPRGILFWKKGVCLLLIQDVVYSKKNQRMLIKILI